MKDPMVSPYLLAMDTSGPICSIALSKGSDLVYSSRIIRGLKASEYLHLLIAECLESAAIQLQDLSAIGICSGPGSYTGLRIGFSTAKSLCYALNIPLLTLNIYELAVLHASNLHACDYYMSVVYARKDEIYTAILDASLHYLTHPTSFSIQQVDLSKLLNSYPDLCICGNPLPSALLSQWKSLSNHKAIFQEMHISAALPRIVDLYQRGAFEDTFSLHPNYFKAPFITKSKKSLFD